MIDRARAGVGLAVGVALVALAGCPKKDPGPRREPHAVAIRNDTGGTLRRVTVERRELPADALIRVGSVAPVWTGVEAVVERTALSPSLHGPVTITWIDADARVRRARLDLARTLAPATGRPGERLVIVVGPGDRAEAVLEPAP